MWVDKAKISGFSIFFDTDELYFEIFISPLCSASRYFIDETEFEKKGVSLQMIMDYVNFLMKIILTF